MYGVGGGVLAIGAKSMAAESVAAFGCVCWQPAAANRPRVMIGMAILTGNSLLK
jgi:hypothetical protein